MLWQYQGFDFTSELAQSKIDEGYLGFVYEITDASNGMKYIGKKLLFSKKKLPPLKGQKRKRLKIVESDWTTYYGSSETVKEQVALRPDDFSREILEFAKSKGILNYIEMKYQVDRQVLLRRSEYYNGIINVRINASHVKDLWIN
jgi:hypothetical protein